MILLNDIQSFEVCEYICFTLYSVKMHLGDGQTVQRVLCKQTICRLYLHLGMPLPSIFTQEDVEWAQAENTKSRII